MRQLMDKAYWKNTDPFKQIFLDAKGENSFRNLDGEYGGRWDATIGISS